MQFFSYIANVHQIYVYTFLKNILASISNRNIQIYCAWTNIECTASFIPEMKLFPNI